MLVAPVSRPRPEQDDTTRRFVAWTLRHGRWLWLGALLLALPAAWRTAGLYAHLRSDVEALLPPDAPSFRAIEELRARMPGLQFLGVLVDAGENAPPQRIAAAERLVDDLATRVRQYPKSMVGGVRVGFGAERAFIERHAPMLIAHEDLVAIRERLEARLHYEYATQTGTLLDDSEAPPPLDFSDIERRYQTRAPTTDLVGDRFTSPRQGLSLLLIEAAGFSTSARDAMALLERVQGDVGALGGAGAYAAGLKLGYTGDVAVSAEETSALMADLTLSTLFVVVAVMLALWVYFRWARAIVALFLPLSIATVCAFALASLLGVRELNSNTAFLGSIIVGNGINFAIIQLARYVEARRSGVEAREAIVVALASTRTGTLLAALAAAVAYGSLTAMQFRGFRQFGVIGGLGMVLAWAATFLLGPSLIVWLDRGSPPTVTAGASRSSSWLAHPMTWLARRVSLQPRAIVVVAGVLTLLAVVKIRTFGNAQLEYDFSRLRRADTWTMGEGYWGKKMDGLLGQYLTPTVLLTDSYADARKIARGVRDAMAAGPPLGDMVASVRSVDDILPVDQDARRAEIELIRKKLTPRIRAEMTPEQLRKVDQLLGPTPVPPISAQEVPETLLKGLRERDGTAGRAVLVYPKPTAGLWEGPRNAAFVDSLRAIARADAPQAPARVAGGPPLTADIIGSMRRDGPLASGLAFVGVVLTVVLLFRRGLATPFVLGSLVVGVIWLLALTMVLRIKINFINFIAFPITFGIGVDYAVNVMARYLRDGGRDVAGTIRGTGGAVGLCSLTTILGYSSLLVAQNRGLFSFGLTAVLGELTCLTAAVVVLPAALLWVGRRPPTAELPTAPPPVGGGKIEEKIEGKIDGKIDDPARLRPVPDLFERP